MGFIDDASRSVLHDGQEARLYERGDGPTVLVLHGWGGRIESMAPVLTCLGEGARVLALDLPGFGHAPAPRAAWGTPEYAAFVAGVLADLGVERAHLVGHSFGAKVSLYLAATEPALVDKLVLVGSSGLRTPASFKARMKRAASRAARGAGRFGAPGEKVRAAIYGRIASTDYRDAGPMRPVLVKVVNEDLEAMLGAVRAPTLIVWGTKDDAVPVAHARTMAAKIPDAGLVLFEGAGHFAYLDEPDRFCRVLNHFLG